MTMRDARTSILASLTAEVMADKKVEARKLTPVVSDVTVQSSTVGGIGRPELPNDTGLFMSNERLRDHAKDLRKFASEATAIAEGLDLMLAESSDPGEVPVDPAVVQKAKEREADEAAEVRDEVADFNAAYEAKQAAAQAAVFGGGESAWVCPDHGKSTIKTSAKTGKSFTGCPDCAQFQR